MKAAVLNKYGSPDNFKIGEVNKPVPKDNEVLVKVHATSVNSWDWDIINGIPFVNRLDFGISRPNNKIIGCDISGRVEEVGEKAKELKTGDEIFGDISSSGWGGFAEYVCVPENVLALKPGSLTFEESAAIPHSGVLTLQGLRKGDVQKGYKVLINGAGGGSGTIGVQIAKSFGAEVTVVDKGEKLDMLHSIGADHSIDYNKEDFVEIGQLYDLILDVVTFRSIFDYKKVLTSKGKYVMLGGGSYDRVFQCLLLGPMISLTGSKKMGILMHKPNKKDLNILTEYIETGKLRPVVDRNYPLEQISEAFRYFGEGNARGKVIISVEQNN